MLDWPEVIFGNPSAELASRCPGLRWLQIVSAGFDEYQLLANSMVMVTTAHGVHARPSAQHVLMAMLSFARGQPRLSASQRAGQWDRDPGIPFDLTGQTLGFLGYGLIAQEISRAAAILGLRMRAVKCTLSPRPLELEQLATIDALDQLLAESDHVVITLPLTTETRGLVDSARVGLLKRGAFLYNVARGGLVDEAAVLARLREGSLGGSAFDVFAQEPLPQESPWWLAPNAIVTPHLAGHHRELGRFTFDLFADNLARYLQGAPLRNQANFSQGY